MFGARGLMRPASGASTPSRIRLTAFGRGPVRGPVSVSAARVGGLAPAPRPETLIFATVIHLSRVFAWWTGTANTRTIQAGRAAAISLVECLGNRWCLW
jgi:hypothetical protein